MTGTVEVLTENRFEEEIQGSALPVVVDFWAPWCGPCKALATVLTAIAVENRDRLRIFKLNIEEEPQSAARYGVRTFPTLLVFRDGIPVKRMVGARGKGRLLRELEEFLQ